MHEIVVDGAQVVAMVERIHQLFAHAHKCGGTSGREIEPTEQFLPARLGGGMQLGGCRVRGQRAPRVDGLIHPRLVDAEALPQRLEEGDARADGKLP